MPRLFIRHEPVDCTVTEGLRAPHIFIVRRRVLVGHGITLDNTLDLSYVCFAHNGDVWAARTVYTHPDNSLVRVLCVKMDDQPCVQQMLLTDMILD